MIFLQVNTVSSIVLMEINRVNPVQRYITLVSVCQMGIMRCLDLPGHRPILPVC